jgi:hypothetical protein
MVKAASLTVRLCAAPLEQAAAETAKNLSLHTHGRCVNRYQSVFCAVYWPKTALLAKKFHLALVLDSGIMFNFCRDGRFESFS